MPRIVVGVRWRPPADPDVTEVERDRQWAEVASPLFERAGALGGRVVAWADRYLAVDFAWDGLYDAVDFLVDAPLLPELCSGLCHGEVAVVWEAPRVALYSGALLRNVEQLTLLARPGEVLVTPELAEASGGSLGTVGSAGKRPGRPDIEALILDPERPLDSVSLRGFGAVAPSSRGASGRARQSGDSEPPFELEPAPVHDPVEEASLLEFRQEEALSLRSPALAERQLARLVESTEAVQREPNSIFPPDLGDALKDNAPRSLAALALSAGGPSSDVAERLGAMAELASGKSGEALRRLRAQKAKVAGESPEVRSRAALALGVALGASGRPYEAALETLDALARTREAGDERGERACARFLSQLARTVGDVDAAREWEALSPTPHG